MVKNKLKFWQTLTESIHYYMDWKKKQTMESQQQQYLSPSPFFDTPPTPTTPDSVTWTHDSTRLLGRGTSGTVFLGTFNGIEAAVKRVGKLDFRNPAADQNREEKAMTKLNHPNILRLFYVASDDHFKYK